MSFENWQKNNTTVVDKPKTGFGQWQSQNIPAPLDVNQPQISPQDANKRAGEVFDIATKNEIPLDSVERNFDEFKTWNESDFQPADPQDISFNYDVNKPVSPDEATTDPLRGMRGSYDLMTGGGGSDVTKKLLDKMPTPEDFKTIMNDPKTYPGGWSQEVKDRALYASLKVLPFMQIAKKIMLAGETPENKKAFNKAIEEMPDKFTGLGQVAAKPTAEVTKLALDWAVVYPALFKTIGIGTEAIKAIPSVAKAGKYIESVGGLDKLAYEFPRVFQVTKEAVGAGVQGFGIFGGVQAVESIGEGTPYRQQIKDTLTSGGKGFAIGAGFNLVSSVDKALYIKKLRNTMTGSLRSEMKSAFDKFDKAGETAEMNAKTVVVDGQIISVGGRADFIRQNGEGFNAQMSNLQRLGLQQIDSIVSASEAELLGLTKGDLYGNIGGKVTPPQQAAAEFMKGYTPGKGESYKAGKIAETLKTDMGQSKPSVEYPKTIVGEVKEDIGQIIKQIRMATKFGVERPSAGEFGKGLGVGQPPIATVPGSIGGETKPNEVGLEENAAQGNVGVSGVDVAGKQKLDPWNRKTSDYPIADSALKEGKAEVVEMTPYQYINKAVELQGIDSDQALTGIDYSKVQKYMLRMKKGDKFPMLVLEEGTQNQEGRHRALAAEELYRQTGERVFVPVVVVKSKPIVPEQGDMSKKSEKVDISNKPATISSVQENEVARDNIAPQDTTEAGKGKTSAKINPNATGSKKIESDYGLPVVSKDKKTKYANYNLFDYKTVEKVGDIESEKDSFRFDVFVGKNKVDTTKPFTIAYFGDIQGNSYEYSTADNDISNVYKTLQEWDSQRAYIVEYNPINKSKFVFEAYPFSDNTESGILNIQSSFNRPAPEYGGQKPLTQEVKETTQTSIGAARDIQLDEALNKAIAKEGTTFTKQVKDKWINSTEAPKFGDYYISENGEAKFVEGVKLFPDESVAIEAGQYIADNTKKPQYITDTVDGFEITDSVPDTEHTEILPSGEGLTREERALMTPQQIAEFELAQQEGGRVGFKKGRAETLREARQKLDTFKMKTTLTDKLRIEASDMVNDFVPREKRGDFIKRIINAKTNDKVKSLAEDIEKYLTIAEKRIALAAIKKAVKRIGKSNSIAVDYVEAIDALLGDIDLVKVSEGTKNKVDSAKAYIESQKAKGENVSLPNKLLNTIERLNKQNIENITTEELKQLHDDIVQLEKIGRTKLRIIKERYDRKKQQDLDRLVAESKPMTNREMAKPEKIGENLPVADRLKNKFNNLLNISAKKHLSIVPMDVFFDTLDGVKNYKGANHEIFKKTVDVGYSKYLDKRDSITLPVVDLADKLRMKPGNYDRIGTHAIREQVGGEQKLLDTGYTKEQIDAVELSPQEMEVYVAMRKALDKLRPDIEEVMRVTYNQPLGTVKNYFSFMTDFEKMSDYEMRDRFADMNPDMRNNYRKNTEKGFTKERVGGTQKIKINAMEVFTKHVDNATYLVEMASEIKRLGEIAASAQYRDAVGDLGQEQVRSWIDLLARKGKQAGDRIQIVDTLRKHTGAAVLGFKLSSALIQPTALLDGAALIGHYAFEGATDIATSRQWREFLVNNCPELRDRIGDDPAYLDFGGTGILTKVEKSGFWALQKLDSLTASAVTAGAYRKYMVEHGQKMDFNNPNQDAINYAQLMLRKTQSSAMFKDLPPAFTRGELTGNKSVDRLILQFQSFMLSRWSLIEHDMLRAGIKGGNTAQMMNIFFFLSLATLAEIGIRRLSKETVAYVTGAETKDWSETFTKELVLSALQNIPFVSQGVSFWNYGSVPVPSISIMQSIGNRMLELKRTKNPDKRQVKELELLILISGWATGMPGTLQAADLVRKSGQTKKTGTDRNSNNGILMRRD